MEDYVWETHHRPVGAPVQIDDLATTPADLGREIGDDDAQFRQGEDTDPGKGSVIVCRRERYERAARVDGCVFLVQSVRSWKRRGEARRGGHELGRGSCRSMIR